MSRHARHRSILCTLLVLALHAIAGCVPAGTRLGSSELHRDYDAGAIPRLRARADAAPRDASRQRELGVAYYDVAVVDSSARQAATDSALQALWKARDLSNQDARTLFYIGATHELRGELQEAMDAYRLYAGARGERGDRVAMEKRLAVLHDRQLAREAESAIRAENGIRAADTKENAVAIPPFSSIGFRDSLRAIGSGFANLVAADLALLADLKVLEREHLDVLVQELRVTLPATDTTRVQLETRRTTWPITDIHGVKEVLQALVRPSTQQPYYSGPIDESLDSTFTRAMQAFQVDRGGNLRPDGTPGRDSQIELLRAVHQLHQLHAAREQGFAVPVDSTTAPLLGRLLRARIVLTGALLRLGDQELQADVLVNRLDPAARDRPAVSRQGTLEGVFQLEKDVVFDIIDVLGIHLDDAQRESVRRNLPTRSLQAFIAWSSGLDLMSQGQTDIAYVEFTRASALDAGFNDARRKAQETDPHVGAPQPPRNDTGDVGRRLGDTSGGVGIVGGGAGEPADSPPTAAPRSGIGLPPTPRPPGSGR